MIERVDVKREFWIMCRISLGVVLVCVQEGEFKEFNLILKGDV